MPILTDLDEQSGVLRRPVTQIVPVDGQHAVAYAQLSVTRGQASLQQVEDIDPVLLRSPHQLDAQLFVRDVLVQHHMNAVVSHRMVGQAERLVDAGSVSVAVRVRTVAVPLLSEHGQPQELARLPQGRHGKVVRHVADVNAIDLKGETEGHCYGPFTARLDFSGAALTLTIQFGELENLFA